MKLLLVRAGFTNVQVKYAYDPFVFEGREGQDATSLKREFFSYLIRLFSLKGLLPSAQSSFEELSSCSDRRYWDRVESIICSYHVINPQLLGTQLAECCINFIPNRIYRIPIVDSLVIEQGTFNNLRIIAPRLALVAIGTKPFPYS